MKKNEMERKGMFSVRSSNNLYIYIFIFQIDVKCLNLENVHGRFLRSKYLSRSSVSHNEFYYEMDLWCLFCQIFFFQQAQPHQQSIFCMIHESSSNYLFTLAPIIQFSILKINDLGKINVFSRNASIPSRFLWYRFFFIDLLIEWLNKVHFDDFIWKKKNLNIDII